MNRAVLTVSTDQNLVEKLKRLVAEDPLTLFGIGPEKIEANLSTHFPVRAVLVDGQLPDALEQVQAVKRWDQEVPVIFMATTYLSREEIRTRQMGAFYCIIEGGAFDNLHRFLIRASSLDKK